MNCDRYQNGWRNNRIGYGFPLCAVCLCDDRLGWSDSGGLWNAAQWTLTIIPWSIPFFLSLWFVYRCVDSGLKRMVIAELSGWV